MIAELSLRVLVYQVKPHLGSSTSYEGKFFPENYIDGDNC